MRLSLECHPDFMADAIKSVAVDLMFRETGQLNLTYDVSGDVGRLKLLEITQPTRTDYLWQTTCFEAFVGIEGQQNYLEFNLSPCTEWAAYSFDSHRKGMRNPDLLTDPKIETELTDDRYLLNAALNLKGMLPIETGEPLEMALSTVIEERDGRKSLWALSHPEGNPDFHNRDCFSHNLEAAKEI